jgi:putative peptidoglycan lipid II flippase
VNWLRRGAAGATVTLTLAAAGGAVFTVARDLHLASKVGLASGLDSLLIAAAVPTAVAGVFAGGLQTALVAAITETDAATSDRRGSRFASTILLATCVVGAGLVGLTVALASEIASVVGLALTMSGRRAAAGYLVQLSPMLLFISADAVTSSIQRAAGHFKRLAIAWIAGPLVALITSVAMWDSAGLRGYATALTLGSAVTALTQLTVLAASTGIARPVMPSRAEIRQLAAHAAPLSGGFAATQLAPLIERFIASFLGSGAVSALRYSELIVRAAVYAAGTAWTTVAYPMLARARVLGAHEFGRATEAAVRNALLAFVPMGIGLAALSPLLVQLAYGRGPMGAGDTSTVALAVIAASPTVMLYALHPVLFGAHNVRRNAAFLGWLAVGTVMVSTTLRAVLGALAGVPGVAAGMPVATAISVIVMAVVLSRQEPSFSLGRIASSLRTVLTLALPIAIPVAVVAWLARDRVTIPESVELSAVLGIVAVSVYAAAARVALRNSATS